MSYSEAPQCNGAAAVFGRDCDGPLVLVCEHASNRIPPELGGLGLTEDQRALHIAWDPGAAAVAREMSARFNSPLVESRVSRLVYDCNRPPEAADAMAAVSEGHRIPGNETMSASARAARVAAYYRPFEDLLARTLSARRRTAALVTIHSFTPHYRGQRRAVELGILHGEDPRMAQSLMAVAADHTDMVARLNEPYGPEDGVSHTLNLHGCRNGIPNAMLEIRSDLIETPEDQVTMAQTLGRWLAAALAHLSVGAEP